MRLLVFVILVTGCVAVTEPRQFTLGPGCWAYVDVYGPSGKVRVKGHYPVCPDPMEEGWTLLHYDTVWVGK